MKIIFFTALVFFSWAGQNGLMAQKTIINDPNAELRPVKGFHAIEVSGAIDLFLSQSDQEAVAVSAIDTVVRARIRTEVVNGVLRIGFENNGWKAWKGSKKLRAYVSFTALDKLGASGASNIYVDGFLTVNSLHLDLSGASDFKGAVKVSELVIVQSGASDVSITGSVAGLTTINASGASDVKGYDLVTETCSVQVSGASDIKITVNKELNAHASGASSVNYKGDAVIKDLHSSGASSVSRKS